MWNSQIYYTHSHVLGFYLNRFASLQFFKSPSRCLNQSKTHAKPASCYTRYFSLQNSAHKAQSEPLRILFCGSDEQSAACVRALDQERKDCTSGIKSIDVVCRPEKRSGRGSKTIRKRPLVDATQELGLRFHEIDTFTGWNPPQFDEAPSKINLIIAVSFGLFVPPRLLKGSLYGGLNIHPSMLPDLRGASPVHWTLLYSDKLTGITLQTLHPEKFDHGTILKQTPHPGFAVPQAMQDPIVDITSGQDSQYAALFKTIQRESAKLLVEGLRDRVYLPPLKDVGWLQSAPENESNLRMAPKIKDEHHHIDWKSWSAEQIMLRQRILGSIWSLAVNPSGVERLKFTKPFTPLEKTSRFRPLKPNLTFPAGCPYVGASSPMARFQSKHGQVLVNTCDGHTLQISEMRGEGLPSRDPLSTSIKQTPVTKSKDTSVDVLHPHAQLSGRCGISGNPNIKSKREPLKDLQNGRNATHSAVKESISSPILKSTTNIKIAASEDVNATPLRFGELSDSSSLKSNSENNTLQRNEEAQKAAVTSSRSRLSLFRSTRSGSILHRGHSSSQSKPNKSPKSGFTELSNPVPMTTETDTKPKRRSAQLLDLGKGKINNIAESYGIRRVPLSLRRDNVRHQQQKSWSSATKTSIHDHGDSMRELLSLSLPRRSLLKSPSTESFEKSFLQAIDKLDLLGLKEDPNGVRTVSTDVSLQASPPETSNSTLVRTHGLSKSTTFATGSGLRRASGL
ncbi:MAG: hypothetical protein Q9160_004430 [Pyrenula sp. 1 TL-2023]